MPRIRNLDCYPHEAFVALVQRVLTTREPVVVPCTRLQALSLQGELYAWRRACEGQPDAAATMGVPVQEMRKWSLRLAQSPSGEFLGLQMLLTEQVPAIQLITAALGGEISPLESESAAALRRLRAMVGESNDGKE